MEFGQLDLTNFRSFCGQHSFSFEGREPGLYFLTGRNTAEPRLGSNGAGKSSLIDGLCWALYGRTTRGLRGPQVCNWSAEKGCEAAVSIGDVTVRRGWNPNLLRVEDDEGGVDFTQEELERDLLSLSYSSFLYSIVLSQFGSFFFDLTPANKMAVLSDVLDIDYWSDRSKDARNRWNVLKEQRAKVESRIESLRENTDALRTEIRNYKKKSREFQKNKEHNLKVQRDYVAQLEKRYADTEKEAAQAQTDIDKIGHDRKAIERKLSSARTDYTQIRDQVRQVEYEIKLVQQSRDSIDRALEKLSGVTDQCPYCYQSVSAEHIAKEKKEAKDERSKVFAQMAEIYNRLSNHKKHLKSAEARVEELQRELANADSLHAGANDTLRTKSNELSRVTSMLEQARADLEREERSEDFYTAEWKRYRKSLADTYWEIRARTRELTTLDTEIAQAGYWVDGFKSVRLFLVEESIHFLEVETNNALTNLGLVDWRVRFDIQRETKEGAISKGFSVMVYSPSNDKEVPWEVWAGGETQRLRLAGALALSNLVLNSKGATSNILLVDEPSAHLDVEGMADILDALQDYAVANSKQIWLIDHRSYDYGDFKDEVVVEKDANGASHIVT